MPLYKVNIGFNLVIHASSARQAIDSIDTNIVHCAQSLVDNGDYEFDIAEIENYGDMPDGWSIHDLPYDNHDPERFRAVPDSIAEILRKEEISRNVQVKKVSKKASRRKGKG